MKIKTASPASQVHSGAGPGSGTETIGCGFTSLRASRAIALVANGSGVGGGTRVAEPSSGLNPSEATAQAGVRS